MTDAPAIGTRVRIVTPIYRATLYGAVTGATSTEGAVRPMVPVELDTIAGGPRMIPLAWIRKADS